MCTEKIKFAGVKSFASNVEYQGTVSLNTKLTQTSCLDVQEVIGDLYSITDDIITGKDFSTLTNSCGTLPTIKNEKTLIQYLIDRNCAQQTQIDALIAQNTIQASQILVLQTTPCP